MQETVLSFDEVTALVERLKSCGLDKSYVESLLKTEIFKNYKELLIDGDW